MMSGLAQHQSNCIYKCRHRLVAAATMVAAFTLPPWLSSSAFAQELPVDLARERKIVADAHAIMSRSADILAKVKDSQSIHSVRIEIGRVEKEEEYRKILEAFLSLPARTRVFWQQRLGAVTERSWERCHTQYKRLSRIPGAMHEFRDVSVIYYIDVVYARIVDYDINKEIDPALARYWDIHRRYPETLKHLFVAKNPRTGKDLWEHGSLNDSWGQLIQYDIAGVKNNGERPDVWSLGPPHWSDRPWTISNWKPFHFPRWIRE